MEVLLQLPLQQVHIMRDIRLKQIEEQQKQTEKEHAQASAPAKAGVHPGLSIPAHGFEDLMDELS